MTDILEFKRPAAKPEGVITTSEFNAALNQSDRQVEVARLIGQTTGLENYTVPAGIRLGTTPPDTEVTGVHELRLGKDRGFALPAAFARTLQTTVDRDRALEVSANYLIGFAMVKVGLLKAIQYGYTLRGVTAKETLMPDVWRKEQTHNETADKVALPYRAAAYVALSTANFESLTVKGTEPPYVLPLASLANPLNAEEFHDLGSILRYR